MVTQERTSVIDPEFVMYGPISFDLGKYFGNLVLAYFSQDGHKKIDTEKVDREDYKEWILGQIVTTWNLFVHKFYHLWDTKHHGDLYTYLKGNKDGMDRAKSDFMNRLFKDFVGVIGIVGIRRILYITHTIDL